jgi:signal transduction histidine kinase
MYIDSLNLDESFCEEMLNIYDRELHLAAILKIKYKNRDIVIYSQNYAIKFCSDINLKYPGTCKNCSSSYFEELHMCQVGLWFRCIPIEFYNERLGSIHIGQRLIRGLENESRAQLSNFLRSQGASRDDCHYYLNLLDSVESVDQTCYDIHLIERSSLIKRYLALEVKNISKMEQRIDDTKVLAQNLAHQFLLPIQAILANSENLILEYAKIDKKYQDPDIIEMIYDIIANVKKLAYSADNLRNWIAVDVNNIYKYEFKRDSLWPILIDTIELFRREASMRGIHITGPIIKDVPIPSLKISTEHMKRVFFNIMSNAIKYSFDGNPKHPRIIEIICSPNGDYYCITTTNYGVGILPEEMDEIFKNGYRGKLAKDRNRYGSGLGMGVVKRIVEDHGGKVFVESTQMDVKDWGVMSPFKTSVIICLPI